MINPNKTQKGVQKQTAMNTPKNGQKAFTSTGFWSSNQVPEKQFKGLSDFANQTLLITGVSSQEGTFGECWRITGKTTDIPFDSEEPETFIVLVTKGYESRDNLIIAIRDYLDSVEGEAVPVKVVQHGRFNNLVMP